jgi:hypothetical protein
VIQPFAERPAADDGEWGVVSSKKKAKKAGGGARLVQVQDRGNGGNVLWVGSLPPKVTEEQLRQAFRVGHQVKISVKEGYAFLNFHGHCDSGATCFRALSAVLNGKVQVRSQRPGQLVRLHTAQQQQ